MDELTMQMHLRAGQWYGRKSTCGKKVDFKSETTATRNASVLSVKFNHEMEAYPCCFCRGWHIGRKMTVDEQVKILQVMIMGFE